ncbi:MAG: flagellar basal body-associated FliL family protein [Gammaproteobacteria bacterium]|nr:flagellar basal body-associated FliL family protein [Gammaproteobacteria bacterium]TVQ44734.1 MAG: flagellar basal body protein FliL [Gammaproteobacteria bacterium]
MSAEMTAEQPAPKKSRLPLILGVVVLLVGGGAGGAWYAGLLPGGPAAEADPDAPSVDRRPELYHTLDSNLVVNLRGDGRSRARYLQVGIEVMTRDPQAMAALQTHNAVVRNNLIMLLSDQTQEDLSTREGREALQTAALEEIRAVLSERFGDPGIESLYFTSFVMQ